MADTSTLDNSTLPVATNPHEIALQSLCKQLLKSRLFRGYYLERCYVDNVKGYRDIVSLQKSEKDLEKMIRDIGEKLQMFYCQNPQMWIGITSGPLTGIANHPGALETYIWVEMEDLAFGQYWFTIKSMRFRENEVIVKLKTVRSVDEEEIPKWSKPASIQNTKQICDKPSENLETLYNSKQTAPVEDQISLDDFILILQQWWTSMKQTVYNFMSQDISKENIISVLRFLGLLIVSIVSGAFVAVKILGVFTLRFMFELSRFTHVSTPIIFKIIEVFNKIIGGFYILLAMIWKDVVVNRKQKQPALEYNRPMYKSIEYDVTHKMPQHGSSPTVPEYERRFL